MDATGCERLRDVLRGCRLVILTATEMEAAPLLAALAGPERLLLATKTLYVGELSGGQAAAGPGPAAPGPRVVLAVGGCDKANTAHVLTALLQAMDPAPCLVLQAGIAGALPAVGNAPTPAIGDLVLATSEAYSDTGSSSPEGWLAAAELGLPIARVDGAELGGVFPLDAGLVGAALGIIAAEIGVMGAATEQLPSVFAGPCITASMTTGIRADADELAERWGALAESMEGAAAAHVCALYGAPFLEVRGISNMVDDRDRSGWQVGRAVTVAGGAALAVAARLEQVIAESTRSRDAGPGEGGGNSGGHGCGRPEDDSDAAF